MTGRKAPEPGTLLPFEVLSRNQQLRRIARGELEPADTRGAASPSAGATDAFLADGDTATGPHRTGGVDVPRRVTPIQARRCSECGLLFTPKRRDNARWCSDYCWNVHRRRDLEGRNAERNRFDGQDYTDMIELRRQGWDYDRIAVRFKTTRDTAYCFVYRFAPEISGVVPRTCEECGQTFEAIRSHTKYCSEYCGYLYRRDHVQEALRPVSLTVAKALAWARHRRTHYQITGQWLTTKPGKIVVRKGMTNAR